MMRLVGAVIYVSIALLCGAALAQDAVPRWSAYYGSEESWERFKGYGIIVFDGDHHPPVRPLTGHGSDVLAYVSLLEIDPSRSFYPAVKRQRLLLDQKLVKRPVIDIRNDEWMAYLIEEVIPRYVREGFTGIMFDTADTAAFLEESDPVKYRGMRQATAKAIRHIRMHYPYLKLMLNRGFDMLDDVYGDVDMVLAESIYIDSRTASAQPFPASHYQAVMDRLKQARQLNPKLAVLSLDYWDMNDTQGVKAIYKRQRDEGNIPYVSTHDLQKLYEEPQ